MNTATPLPERIIIEVAGEATGKGRPRATRTGRIYTPARTVAAEAKLAFAAAQVMADREPLNGPLKLKLEIFVSVPKSWSKRRRAAALAGAIKPTIRPDADNVLKLVADSCNHVVYCDDKQLIEVFVRKRYAAAGRMLIAIEPLLGEDVEERP